MKTYFLVTVTKPGEGSWVISERLDLALIEATIQIRGGTKYTVHRTTDPNATGGWEIKSSPEHGDPVEYERGEIYRCEIGDDWEEFDRLGDSEPYDSPQRIDIRWSATWNLDTEEDERWEAANG